jgi:hypothetical protein
MQGFAQWTLKLRPGADAGRSHWRPRYRRLIHWGSTLACTGHTFPYEKIIESFSCSVSYICELWLLTPSIAHYRPGPATNAVHWLP